ncbi:hypothetical protein G3N58_18660 [Paraburkholderia sp. Ac-20342]|uniref:DUF6616 family protein n=1 Tax=Paraburkholderia sp. Ac-20342 TaxID=2703889 RepID=UPI00197E8D79|nr:DUF6616 family protein [Paraburkholderia sp. Ac-20342]MBN3848832.1 hypothetical protein [Paraburkholderia sp. Ac-20342]
MSHYLVELYTPNATWKAFPREQRQQFLRGIQAAMGGLSGLCIEVLVLGRIERGIDHVSEHCFLGIWRFPGAQARDALLAGIQASGWYGSFDHVNATASDTRDIASHLSELVAF